LIKQGDLEAKIEKLESQVAEIDAALADPDTYRDADKVRSLQERRERLAGELSPLEEEWLSRAE